MAVRCLAGCEKLHALMWFQWQFLTNSVFIVNIDVHWLILEINICTIFACSVTKHLNSSKISNGGGALF